MKRLEVFFDVVSPYTYLAVEQLIKYKQFQIEFVPVFLGGVMQLSGNQPPANNKNKASYMLPDLKRLSSQAKVPMKIMPSKFPINTLAAQRLLCAIREQAPSSYVQAIREIFQLYWVQDVDISQPENLKLQCLTPNQLDKFIQVDSKAKLQANTQRAVDEFKMFGAPLIIAYKDGHKPQKFFGQDRIESLCAYMEVPYQPLVSKL